MVFADNQFEKTRTQDLKTFYHDAGMFYFVRVSSFKNTINYYLNLPLELS